MPRQPQWYQRVPAALEAISRFPAPVIDRQALESLLGVGRRDAIRLMHRLGGYQVGRTFLVERDTLAAMLRGIAAGSPWQWETRRRQRLGEQLQRARSDWQARRVTLDAAPAPAPGLGDTIRLQPGRLEVEFRGAVDLLSQLLQLTKTISADYDRFEEFLGG